MVRYAIIDSENVLVGISNLLDVVPEKPDMILVSPEFDFELRTKKWNGTSWESYTPPELPEPEPTQLDRMEAQLMKSQDEVRQEGADMVMEELVKRGLIV